MPTAVSHPPPTFVIDVFLTSVLKVNAPITCLLILPPSPPSPYRHRALNSSQLAMTLVCVSGLWRRDRVRKKLQATGQCEGKVSAVLSGAAMADGSSVVVAMAWSRSSRETKREGGNEEMLGYVLGKRGSRRRASCSGACTMPLQLFISCTSSMDLFGED